jgi:flavin-binding protein dodecin
MEEMSMSVAKVTEITASSKKSFEEAVAIGIKRASKTLKNIKGAWVNEMSVTVSGNKISEYRVNMKITFVLSS